ncbi:YraN family protein [Paracoccus pacificus]|uniref:UPF0102 protein ACFSCT_03910 n=1 Tax=Paracoccus pacificus TaxID=1463598 RepID=A0ABW4R4I2_9RHOB
MGRGTVAVAARSVSARQVAGVAAFANGQNAELRVAERYEQQGYEILARRWRGKAGEIDLIARHDGDFIFIEVKRADTRDMAAERLSRRQMDRICLAACEFCATQPMGQAAGMRFDAALVDGSGMIDIIENAFGGH